MNKPCNRCQQMFHNDPEHIRRRQVNFYGSVIAVVVVVHYKSRQLTCPKY